MQMERKPQQQTLSIRISESLREFLERSKRVISAGREDFVSTSDVAKILLESAKDEGLDYRLEVADLGSAPTEALDAIRKKWKVGQPRSRAEWIFMAQYIQIACEELTGDPLAPSAESYAVLLESLLAVRGLRTDRGLGLDRYYLGYLADTGTWSDRKLDNDVLPEVVGKLVNEVRGSKNGKRAAGVGRCFYAAVRDEEFQEIAALNNLLAPSMDTLFRMAARGHWIREKRPVRALRDGPLLLGNIPPIKQDGLWLSVQPHSSDLSFNIGLFSGNVMYQVIGYPQIREFHAMLNALVPGDRWNGVDFFGSGELETKTDPPYYQFRRNQDGVTLSLPEDDWGKLKAIYGTAMAEPTLQGNFAELSMIYGDL